MDGLADFDDVLCPPLRVKQAGGRTVPADFKIGPRTIPEFGIAFVYSGKGWVLQAQVRHVLTGGELFLIFPNTRYTFEATRSRWRVYWVNFTAPALAPALRRAGITPRNYLRRGCDRDLLKHLCESLIAAGRSDPAKNVPAAAARVWDILALLQSPNPRDTETPERPGSLAAVRRYLEQHPTEPIRVADLAARSHLSQYHFIRKFRRETGFSPHQFQIHQRLLKARRLLMDGKSVKETAHALGYDDLFYFSRLFKRKTGVSPSQYAQRGVV